MAQVFWISPLTERDPVNRPNSWSPLALELAQASGPVEIKWETTSGNINLAPRGKRYTVGVADIDDVQRAALEGEGDIGVIELADRGSRRNQINPVQRAKLDEMVLKVTDEPTIDDVEDVEAFLTRLINHALGTFRDDRVAVLLKEKDISVPPQAKSGQTILFRDTFTVGSDTVIDVYPSGDPDYGFIGGSAMTVNAANDRVQVPTALTGNTVRFLGAPTGDQEVLCRTNNDGANNTFSSPLVRVAATPGTLDAYEMAIDTSIANEVIIFRYDAGVSTTLASADRGLVAGTHYHRARATGAGATVSLVNQGDGTNVLTFDDTAATRKTSGNAGIVIYNDTANAGWLDDFQVSDAAATRCYFSETEAAAVSPTISATDWEHVNTVRRRLLRSPDSSTLTTTAVNPDGAAHEVTGDSHHRQFVGDPADGDQILMGRVKAQHQGLEVAANNNLSVTYKVYVVSNDGVTVRGTALAITRDDTECNTALRNQQFQYQNLTPISMLNGDRIVTEVGLGGVPAGAGANTHNGSLRFGCSASGGDLPEDSTDVGTTLRPWIEFDTSINIADIGYMRAMSRQWPDIVHIKPTVVASGMTPSNIKE